MNAVESWMFVQPLIKKCGSFHGRDIIQCFCLPYNKACKVHARFEVLLVVSVKTAIVLGVTLCG